MSQVKEPPTCANAGTMNISLVHEERTMQGGWDSIHLAVPNSDIIREGKNQPRFLAPPSSFSEVPEAKALEQIRRQAITNNNYVRTVIRYGYSCVKEEEKVVFPDGTVYTLSSSWVADPKITTLKSEGIQTTPEQKDEETMTPTFFHAN